MKLATKVLIISILFLSALTQAMSANNYKTAEIKGKKCYIYYVAQGEGFYNITRKFNVTRDDIVKYNPSAKSGLNKGQKLYIPVTGNNPKDTESSAAIQPEKKPTIHVVKQKENLYLISKKYNISISEIMTLNGMKSIALQVGDSIKIPGSTTEIKTDIAEKSNATDANSIQEVKLPEPEKENNTVTINGEVYKTEKYIVQRRETLYSISQKFKTTVDNILASNMGIKSISKGDVLNIPMTKEVKKVVEEYKAVNQQIIVPAIEPQSEEIDRDGEKINIAVIMPFMLNNPTPHSKSFLSYYQGLLLAIDSLKQNGLSADVYVYDTEGKVEKVKEILEKSELKSVDIIFGSDSNEDITLIGNYARKNEILLVNSFSIKNNDVTSNRNILQGYIPSAYFYPTASSALVKSVSDKEVILLIDNNEVNDKKDFIDVVSSGLRSSGKEFKKFNFKDVPDYEAFLPSLSENANILFVATSSTRNGVAKTTALLGKIKEARPDISISLFGYPEWQTYTKEYLDKFHALNTTIFTRFYIQNTLSSWKNFNNKYKFWFGENNNKILPAPDVLGFDTGIYLLKGFAKYGNNFHKHFNELPSESIQTDFSFERSSDNGGYINKNIYFVNFTPSFEIIKENIKE